ncbi:MAG: hypothetical protein JJE04_01030 [Acidobacteriia bacterium]|nr:hypothetical protein [Terriglobia bacterium]
MSKAKSADRRDMERWNRWYQTLEAFDEPAQNGAARREPESSVPLGFGGAASAIWAFVEHAQNGAARREPESSVPSGFGGAASALCAIVAIRHMLWGDAILIFQSYYRQKRWKSSGFHKFFSRPHSCTAILVVDWKVD